MSKIKSIFDKYFLSIFTFVFSFVLYYTVGVQIFSKEYVILYVVFIAGIIYYSTIRKRIAKIGNKALDSSIEFFDDYEDIPAKFESLTDSVVFDEKQRLTLTVEVKDKVVASVYLMKWISTANCTPFGCKLENITLIEDKNEHSI